MSVIGVPGVKFGHDSVNLSIQTVLTTKLDMVFKIHLAINDLE